jgi:hypothetical protein
VYIHIYIYIYIYTVPETYAAVLERCEDCGRDVGVVHLLGRPSKQPCV